MSIIIFSIPILPLFTETVTHPYSSLTLIFLFITTISYPYVFRSSKTLHTFSHTSFLHTLPMHSSTLFISRSSRYRSCNSSLLIYRCISSDSSSFNSSSFALSQMRRIHRISLFRITSLIFAPMLGGKVSSIQA